MKTDKNLMPYFKSLKQNKIKCKNYVRTREEALCFNILEIPPTEELPQPEFSILTVSVMYRRKKRAKLADSSFAKVMNTLEETLELIRYKYGIEDTLCLTPVHNTKVNNSWYSLVECHRLFFLPTEMVFSVLEELTSASFLSLLNGVVSETSFYVNTLSHQLKIVKITY